MSIPRLLALDFDGVVCDGLKEYFQTAWRAYLQVCPHAPLLLGGLAEAFYRLRPVVESGWEMPVLIHALLEGYSEATLLQEWPTLSGRLIAQMGLNPAILAQQVDRVRDEWIAQDLTGWLAQHSFYPGVTQRLRALTAPESPTRVVIISTKEGRFIRQLLAQQGVVLPDSDLIGKEAKRPKTETLRELHQRWSVEYPDLWFVEDRLQTLYGVRQQPDLAELPLFLAAWGYNTAAEREDAQRSLGIQPLTLERFEQDFPFWYTTG
ncbi:HAD family hydrolase [Anthocerotibacter panamensis]|uniref:HAD family hydrolase n=1 Tax=Anthocerotibacter panamensis TaxID=2857077 RepID=UPI001C407886|nr:HAD family hydrolase [Anthocerotibacter panamensis]